MKAVSIRRRAAELALASSDIDIRFGIAGNATSYQWDGLSKPEAGFTWAVGMSASLHLPMSEGVSGYFLILEGHPFLHPPNRNSQTLVVVVNGKELGRLEIDQEFKQIFRYAVSGSDGGGLCLELMQPGADSPSSYGSPDRRQLGIAWRRLRVIASEIDHLAEEATLLSCETFLEEPFKPDVAHVFETTLLSALADDTLSEATMIFAQHYRDNRILLSYDDDLPNDLSLVRCNLATSGEWTFGFPTSWRGENTAQPVCLMVAWHWVASLPLFLSYSRTQRLTGSVILNVGDEAHARGISFCTNAPHSLLIPDPYFMRSRGYEALKEEFASHDVPFTARRPVALWRGSSTGYYDAGGALGLDRVKLCCLAKDATATALMDVGISTFVQINQEEINQLIKLEILKEYVPAERMAEWMFHIDVDGNTNSWPGLFQKLASGGLVFKVESKLHWRQWYYDRLKPLMNFVPVSADMTDLISRLKFYSDDISHAARIASQGRLLTDEMSYESEVKYAMSVLEKAIVLEAMLSDDLAFSDHS